MLTLFFLLPQIIRTSNVDSSDLPLKTVLNKCTISSSFIDKNDREQLLLRLKLNICEQFLKISIFSGLGAESHRQEVLKDRHYKWKIKKKTRLLSLLQMCCWKQAWKFPVCLIYKHENANQRTANAGAGDVSSVFYFLSFIRPSWRLSTKSILWLNRGLGWF